MFAVKAVLKFVGSERTIHTIRLSPLWMSQDKVKLFVTVVPRKKFITFRAISQVSRIQSVLITTIELEKNSKF